MTLAERCVRLETRIEWSSEFHARKFEAEKIKERTEQLELVRQRVDVGMDRAIALRENEVATELPTCHAAIDACRAAAAGLHGATSANKAAAVLEDDAWRRLTTAIEDDAGILEATVRRSIDAAQKDVRDLQLATFEALAIASSKEPEFKQLTEWRGFLLAAPWFARPAGELRQLLKRRADLIKGADRLGDIRAPEEVRRFLESARKGEATITDLTAEVQHWLEENALLGKLRITLAR